MEVGDVGDSGDADDDDDDEEEEVVVEMPDCGESPDAGGLIGASTEPFGLDS